MTMYHITIMNINGNTVICPNSLTIQKLIQEKAISVDNEATKPE